MTVVWAGLATGALYAIVALGFNIVLSASGVFNFAAPQFLMLGAMLSYQGVVADGLPYVLIIFAGLMAGGLLGVVEEVLAIRPLKDVRGHGALVTTVGVSVVLEGIALIIWGSQARVVPFFGSEEPLTILGGRVAPLDLMLIVVAVTLGVALWLLSERTRLGMASRASTSDRELAVLRGVDVRAIRAGAFALAGAVLVAVGTLVGMKLGASVTLGGDLVVLGFVALALGGFGSYPGALVGGFAAGLIQLLTARYIGDDYQLVTLYILLLAVLLVIPGGLLGQRKLRHV
jgi:branched-chain amino acid transport system permease protein